MVPPATGACPLLYYNNIYTTDKISCKIVGRTINLSNCGMDCSIEKGAQAEQEVEKIRRGCSGIYLSVCIIYIYIYIYVCNNVSQGPKPQDAP